MTTTKFSESALPREAYTLLAQANLLRMRGRWEEAVENCMAALRLAPENASAQSLLGDIYENQGRLDDAIQWYRMALDVSPDSPADKIKLSRLLDAKERQTAMPPATAPTRTPRPPAVRNPERLLRWAAWVVTALAVLAIVLAGAAMSGQGGRAGAPIKAPPVTVSTPGVADPPNATDGVADLAEQALLQTLQQDPQLAAQNVSVVGVLSDPRQATITLSLLCAPPAGASAHESLLRDAALAALACSRAQTGRTTAWTLRCYLLPPGSAADAPPGLAFVADTTPTALAALGPDPRSLAAPQLLPAFRSPWWSAGVPP